MQNQMVTQMFPASLKILEQIDETLEQIESVDFCRRSAILNGSTIGQHTRHVLEFYLCLKKGLEEGIVDYDRRNHDKQMETDKYHAAISISQIRNFITENSEDRPLQLAFNYELDAIASSIIPTTYYRELVYNLEHAVHHMAMIKIGIQEIAPYVVLPAHFGIAVSTVRHHAVTEQNR